MRFPLCLGPVLIHLRYLLPRSVGTHLLCGTFSQVAVPMFFVFSGYLLYTGYRPTGRWYAVKCLTRTRSLVVPFLVWGAAALTLSQAVAIASAVSDSRPLGPELYGLQETISRITGIGQRANLPQNSPLWYLRDLFILVLLCPVPILLVRYVPLPGLLAFASLFVLATVQRPILPSDAFTWFTYEGMLFFYIGLIVVGREARVSLWADRLGPYCLVVFSASCVVKAFWHPLGGIFQNPINLIVIPAGMVSAWWLAGRAARSPDVRRRIAWLGQFSVPLYVSHMLVIKMAITAMPMLGATAPMRQWLLALFVLVIIVAGGIAFFLGMGRLCPRVLAWTLGGRTPHGWREARSGPIRASSR